MTTFRHVLSIQSLADGITNFVLDAKPPKSTRTLLLRTINEFESLPWVPIVMDEVHAAKAPMVSFAADLTVTAEGDTEEALIAIDAMLRKYIKAMHEQTAKIAERVNSAKEYTAAEAAAELKISDSMFETYASRRKLVSGRKVGRSILYSQAEIDKLREMRNPVGRPKSKAAADE